MQLRMGMQKMSDPRGYLENQARPSEVTPKMRMYNRGVMPEHTHGLNPMGTLNDKMNGE